MFAPNAAAGSTLPGLTLVEEIGHRVINEYAEAIGSLSIAASAAQGAAANAALERAADRLREHADAHRSLLPPRTAGELNLADYLGGICNAYARATLAQRGVHLHLHFVTVDPVLPARRCWLIGLVVAELVRNAARHGLRGRSGQIRVHIGRGQGVLTCVVSDDGAASANAKPGRGQGVIRALVAELGGLVEWAFTGQGTTAVVQLPDFDQ
ncbi:two-component sensor histidine kinase [Sphingomonas zeicaulis]|uniref:ATP-binding protein n=1 Tax=Sphingomonas zeicaulis TaxID=1632740 RepID=UPI003D200EA5